MNKSFIYQILPRIWRDGKLNSIDDAFLSYLRSFGLDYVWFTGIPRHATGEPFVKGNPGSPYAVCDWYDVNPYLASDPEKRMEEFDALVRRTHEAGLKCIIDCIPNHVACNYEGRLKVHPWCDGDWTDTRKLDWSDPATASELIRILRFWADRGVDGFRCDMVELVPAEMLAGVIAAVKRTHPGLIFIAEAYERGNYRHLAMETGFDLLYDKSGEYDILRGILDGRRSARELSWNWQFLGDLQPRMLNFLENHDEQRLCSDAFAGSPDRTWAALAFAMLFNPASFLLYAGQEAGERASESSDGRTSIFNFCKPESLEWLSFFVQEAGAVSSGSGRRRKAASGKSPDGAASPEAEVIERYRKLIALAREPLFSEGGWWDLCYCNGPADGFDSDRHFVFARFRSGEVKLVFCNFSPAAASACIRIPSELAEAAGRELPPAVSVSVPAYDYSIVNL
ncbi:MAG: hypothetical protein IJS66_07515 [Bacteroidales bacterium]|nr:hypothetical protein [Bacteroidales bacterium]